MGAISLNQSELHIEQIEFVEVDVDLEDQFVISQGTLNCAELLYVRIRLANGIWGYGEMAPFHALTQEDRAHTRRIAETLGKELNSHSVQNFRALSHKIFQLEPDQPAARCGLEIAMLDAYTRSLGIPMWGLWGGAGTNRSVKTDITLPILPEDRTLQLARRWYDNGFRRFKTKVGVDAASDCSRIQAIARKFPDVEFVLDANGGFEPEEALTFLKTLRDSNIQIALFEQPVHKENLEGMAHVRTHSDVPVAADESVTSPADALDVIRMNAADVINLKIMKSGVLGALEIASVTRAAGLKLMIGGMLESRLAMACSLAIVFGLGEIEFIDLDTPLLMARDPVCGGYTYTGPEMSLWTDPGLDMTPQAWS